MNQLDYYVAYFTFAGVLKLAILQKSLNPFM